MNIVARKPLQASLLARHWQNDAFFFFYVILSANEISHNQSEKYIPRQFFGGILHCCYSALNADALKLSFSAFFIKNASAL